MRRAFLLLAIVLACSSSQEPSPTGDVLATPGGLVNAVGASICAAAARCGSDLPRIAGCGYGVGVPDCATYQRQLTASVSAACAAHQIEYHRSFAVLCQQAFVGSVKEGKPAGMGGELCAGGSGGGAGGAGGAGGGGGKAPDDAGHQCVFPANVAQACAGAVLPVACPSPGAAYEQPLACTCAIAPAGHLPQSCLDLAGRALGDDLCAEKGAGGSGGSGGGGSGGGGAGGAGSGGGGSGGSAGSGGHGGS